MAQGILSGHKMLVLKENYLRFSKVVLSVLCLGILFLVMTIKVNADGYSSTTSSPQDSLSKYIKFVRATIIGRYGFQFELDSNGIPTSIMGNLSKGLNAKDPVDAVYEFLEKNKDIFQLVNPRNELVLIGTNPDGVVGPTIKMAWTVNGIKVGCPVFRAQFSKTSGLYEIEGQIDPEARKVDTDPSISEEQAKEIVITDTKNLGTTLDNIKSSELIISRTDSILHLAWVVNICKLDSVLINSDYFIDAKSGAILSKRTRMRD